MGRWLAEDLREDLEAATRAEDLAETEVVSFLEAYDSRMRRVNLTNTLETRKRILGPRRPCDCSALRSLPSAASGRWRWHDRIAG